ncbi:MAG: phenylacetate-CoA oxygenase subunit PaaJ [Chitinophagales bacterium]|nr:phenylacetate-CoA oxygenase subunit PaaJ [Chitinophagales bacterium]MDW8427180.1 1,2-phenylacetyl-CoA epoxidase subunit PaaD [Chitinophagales bacterium]
MVTTHTLSDPTFMTADQVLQALHDVHDPEIPALSIVDLGMIGELIIQGENITVKLIPTFIACPALDWIRHQVKERLKQMGFRKVEVVHDDQTVWTSDRISEEGRRKLQAFGLTPPARNCGRWTEASLAAVTCPHCGSSNTVLRSFFGSTLCRSTHYCNQCRQVFESFKPV